jgi:hypothetical protein
MNLNDLLIILNITLFYFILFYFILFKKNVHTPTVLKPAYFFVESLEPE